jgi:peptidyl-prolyl cis-trans isomerase C
LQRASRAALFAALGFLGAGPGCDGGGGEDDILARVAGHAITVADVDARIARIPQMARPEYSGPIGRSRMLNQMIEEEVIYRAAVDEGLDRDPDVKQLLDASTRQILVQTYLDRRQDGATKLHEKELREFYDKHRDEYRQEKLVRVRVLVAKERGSAQRARDLALKGKPFDQLCASFSTDPLVIDAAGLLPNWVRRNKAVPWLGNHPAFHEVVFALKQGEISEVFETPKGFHVARVEEIREERQRTFEEARSDIEARLARERNTTGLPALVDELKQRYRVEVVQPAGRSAEELFTLAQQAPAAKERVALYRELVERHPKNEHVVEALFMIGFVTAEELGDREGAKPAFQRVIDEFPDSELAESARWMLTAEGSESPAFEPAPGETTASEENAP